jgi:Icc-related predicted phosphoesterase
MAPMKLRINREAKSGADKADEAGSAAFRGTLTSQGLLYGIPMSATSASRSSSCSHRGASTNVGISADTGFSSTFTLSSFFFDWYIVPEASMKILAVSDFIEPLHCNLLENSALSDVQLIVSCGDLPPDYLSALSKAFAAPLYYIRGNHDNRYESSPPKNCFNIHAQVVSFGDLSILGLEGSHWYNGRPLQYTEAEMRQIIRFLRPRLRRQRTIDMVITHAPPRHIHDAEDPCHRGFQVFRRLIDRYRPKYFLHGHIHRRFDDPGQRITRIAQTRVINCSGYYVFEYDHE